MKLGTLAGGADEAPRFTTGMAELDRVTGGGIVPGSALLIGGEPGIGKSTLLLQLSASLARAGRRAIYLSRKRAAAQVRLRAERLGWRRRRCRWRRRRTSPTFWRRSMRARSPIWSSSIPFRPCGRTNSTRRRYGEPGAGGDAVADPLCQAGGRGAAAGRACDQRGPNRGSEGGRAHGRLRALFRGGPRASVPDFAGDEERFGATDEIGVFEMVQQGLREVANPSELFLGDREASVPGAAVFAGMEGTRPILVEIQALVAPSQLGTPRRAVVGWDSNRLSMILAVLEARCGISLAQHDVYLNVAGGLKISEPAADLAVASALLSSFSGVALPPQRVSFGEISLSGAVRTSAHMALRLKEAKKLGFTEAVIPALGETGGDAANMALTRLAHLKDLADPLRRATERQNYAATARQAGLRRAGATPVYLGECLT